MDRNDQAWAVFWCSLLSPLLLGEVPEAEREAYFRTLAEQERLRAVQAMEQARRAEAAFRAAAQSQTRPAAIPPAVERPEP